MEDKDELIERAKRLITSIQIQIPETNNPNNEIKKGLKALEFVVENRNDYPDAMRRYDIGKINFYYGTEGNANKKFKGGYGISHIVAKRDWEAENIPSLSNQKGIEVAKKMVEVIAKGDIIKVIENKSTIWIEYDEYIAVLSLQNNGNQEVWLLTGFKIIY